MNTRTGLITKNASLSLLNITFTLMITLLTGISPTWGSAIDQDDDGIKDRIIELGKSSNAFHHCTIDTDGVKCWGLNNDGQASTKDLVNPVMISSGLKHTCALEPNGGESEVKCWGDTTHNQTSVPKLGYPSAISAGLYHTCALHMLGVKCWGKNTDGQTDAPDLPNAVEISSGANHSCAISNGEVICWGSNDNNESKAPVLQNPRSVSAGYTHTCAIDDTGVHCWGENNEGQTDVPGNLVNPVAVSAGGAHTCALDDNGVHCWGATINNLGQTIVPPLSNPIAIAAGILQTCAVDDNGVQCWGDNSYGQLTLPVFSYATKDNCTTTYNPDQLNTDGDSAGNACDNDDDNDGKSDASDPFPLNKKYYWNAQGTVTESLNLKTCISLTRYPSIAFNYQSPAVLLKLAGIDYKGTASVKNKTIITKLGKSGLTTLVKYLSVLSGCNLVSVASQNISVELNSQKTKATLTAKIYINAKIKEKGVTKNTKALYTLKAVTPWKKK